MIFAIFENKNTKCADERREEMKHICKSLAFCLLITFCGCSSNFSSGPNLYQKSKEFKDSGQCDKSETVTFQTKGYDPNGEKVCYHF